MKFCVNLSELGLIVQSNTLIAVEARLRYHKATGAKLSRNSTELSRKDKTKSWKTNLTNIQKRKLRTFGNQACANATFINSILCIYTEMLLFCWIVAIFVISKVPPSLLWRHSRFSHLYKQTTRFSQTESPGVWCRGPVHTLRKRLLQCMILCTKKKCRRQPFLNMSWRRTELESLQPPFCFSFVQVFIDSYPSIFHPHPIMLVELCLE